MRLILLVYNVPMRSKPIALALSGLLFAFTSWCSEKKDLPSPESLISRARLQEEIWTDETPPLILRGEVQLFDVKGAPVTGNYLFYWVSPSRWREEIKFGDYERIRVGIAKGYWQKSTLDYQPHVIFHLDTMLRVKRMLTVSPKQTLGKTKLSKKAGIERMCSEVKWPQGTDRTMCFDEFAGTLLSVDYPELENQHAPEVSRIEYSSFELAGKKLIPKEIRALRNGKAVAAAKTLEITKLSEENSVLFTAPPNAEFWAQCDDMQGPELLNRVSPRYPPEARTNREQGRVVYYAVIEADGSISHLTVIKRATPALDAATIEAIRHWRYKPATCEGTPVRAETSLEADFWVQF